ncbi:hypothetical protein D0T84_11260 [Dysgonomonas sp. 521]|uniref:hypothetical protein n=1 Tax=Dysgonomonas sp. 521 TaxID=2302932 RepID=UPI0013D4CBC7|nr:hypothetical protein [Dysgonomonas sp. 521]NDV95482.1 hypothetical protein [Dysgonomonas sp. 521]
MNQVMKNVSFIIKKENEEVKKLIDQDTKKILFETGLPDSKYINYDFIFDKELTLLPDRIIIGKFNKSDLIIDLNKNESIYVHSPDDGGLMYLNSSLSQLVGYILLYVDFMNKKIANPSNKRLYLDEWERKMIDLDKEAYFHENYYWGSFFESYDIGMLI